MKKQKKNIIECKVTLINKSNVIKPISFFSIGSTYNDPDLEIRLVGYDNMQQLNQGLVAEAYTLSCISIVSESSQQCEQVFEIEYRDARSEGNIVSLAPVLDKLQLFSQIDGFNIPVIEFDGLNRLNYTVQENTTVTLYFEFDKNKSLSEKFKRVTGFNGFENTVYQNLDYKDKIKDYTQCEEYQAIKRQEEIPVIHKPQKSRPQLEEPNPIPAPCKHDEFILEYPLKLLNTSSNPISVHFFSKTTRKYNAHKFILPYAANYNVGFYLIITTDLGGDYRYDVINTLTREQLVSELDALGIGSWNLDPSLLYNDYTLFSETYNLTNLFYDSSFYINITTQPQSQNIHETQSLILNVVANSNDGTISYQWRKNGVNIFGENSDTYTIAQTDINSAADYDCVLTTTNANNTTNAAQIKIYNWIAQTSVSTDDILRIINI